MSLERIKSILEEIQDVETMAELKALWCMGGEYADARFTEAFKDAVRKLRPLNNGAPDPEQLLQEKLAELEALKVRLGLQDDAPAKPQEKPPVPPVVRAGRRYKLLNKSVAWTTKPQIHAIMAILSAHISEGDIVEESDIIRMMVENERVLNTRQGGKRIWDYYKGDHADGLLAHGNVEKL